MRTGFLITARMKSTRLPLKLTMKILDREVIRWMIDRLKLNDRLDEIIICTSTNPQDDILEKIALDENIKVFRGSEEDVIQRLYNASIENKLDYALNITADCPLVSNEYIKKIINKYIDTDADFIRALDLPHGLFSYGIKIKAMKSVCEIKKSFNTEVWGSYFTETGLFKVKDINVPDSIIRKNYRITLDYPEDLMFFKKIFEIFGKDLIKIESEELVEFLDSHQEIVEINSSCKEKYQKRWNSQNKIELK